MKATLFIFGRTPDLSYLELISLYPHATRMVPGSALVSDVLDARTMIKVLGGTVKIAEHIPQEKSLTEDALLSILIGEATDRHVTFGISGYGGVRVPADLTASLKKLLTQRGIVARYVETKHDEALSSVVVSKQQVTEIVAIKSGSDTVLGVTRAVQDFEDWNKRDFGRPAADPKAGMLPPKVARMIVNIALFGSEPGHHPMVFDPFCGVGTLLSEALLRGANVIGSDISEVAVGKTKQNLEWLRKEYPAVRPLYANVFVSDATHVRQHIAPESIDAIVTEPFMGGVVEKINLPRLTPERVKNILKGLEKLYIGSLREWASLLKPNVRVVMAMPAYVTNRTVVRVKNVVDRCESLGYTLLTGPIEYSRPQAIVRREFYIFRKK